MRNPFKHDRNENRPLPEQRARMAREQLQRRDISDARVLDAMTRVPRETFMPDSARSRAYEDAAISIGRGQTISQPYMVAVMSQHLGLAGGETVLEIGTGSGYQSAILAELVGKAGRVYTVERLEELSARARAVLTDTLGYENITFLVGDGTLGWPRYAPYDGIIVTAGAPEVPQPLIEQLADGGRLVVPVGDGTVQTLMRVSRRGDEILKERLLQCRFVPLIGQAGWENGKD